MSKQTLIEKINKLPLERIAEVEKFVDQLNQHEIEAAHSIEQRERQLQQRLLELGLLSEIKPPITDFTPYQNRHPIEVKGKPTSELIIEERR